MKNKLHLLKYILFLIPAIIPAQSKAYYVANGGYDTNPGTLDFPFATVTKAASTASAGDTIYIRGGQYNLSSTISLGKSGSSTSYYHLYAYKNEKPVFNFSTQSSSDGIKVNGNYWHLKGIESTYAAHNGIAINGSYNIIERCSVHDNRNSGMQLGNGAAYNQIINCDAYYNYDSPSGGNADGFAPKLDVGTGNYFYGCRSWQNSDDGFDGYLRPSDNITTTYENCWSFMNGYLKDGTMITTGNGNGFKTGGSDSKDLHHNAVLKNCLCFDNRVKGFDQNNNKGSMTFYNCTGFRNGTYNFSIPTAIDSGYSATIKNSISLESQGVTLISGVVQEANTWIGTFTVSSADFVSIDTTGVRGPRKSDGSLPDVNFMHLVSTSVLIDAGVNVGITFAGNAPDLGAFEYGIAQTPTSVEETNSLPSSYVLKQNYPNPFNPSTIIEYVLPKESRVELIIFNSIGQKVAELVNQLQAAGTHRVQWSANKLSSGIYFYSFKAVNISERAVFSEAKKLILLK